MLPETFSHTSLDSLREWAWQRYTRFTLPLLLNLPAWEFQKHLFPVREAGLMAKGEVQT